MESETVESEGRMKESQNTGTSQENDKKKIESIENLLKECRDLQNQHPDDQFYFRGECNDSWKLRPSVMRRSSFRENESKMLNELMSRQPEAFSGLTSTFSQWVLAQHYGLKTRLLDITRNPLVALFNACEECDDNNKDGRLHIFAAPKEMIKPFNSDTVSIIANFAKLRYAEQNLLLSKMGEGTDEDEDLDLVKERLVKEHDEAWERLYHFIRQEKPYFLENIDLRDLLRVFVVEPQQSFERIRMQSGAFLLSVFHERFERDEILNRNADIPVYDYYTLKVPYTSKRDITEELRLLNITHESLFPGLDEAAKAVTQRYSEE